ncbi:hypothetical protein [Dysgonomonas massiliensis]|uniref:hypothetical protein n=1 Tax=Dysgonomonas massiliensis TaxID=2040292 RepID=UPI000C789C5B|nr:hypothetical protein [Dysgonomonas massiliensis]
MAKATTSSAKTQARNTTGQFIKEIRRNTAKIYTSEQKILIDLEAMCAELSVLCPVIIIIDITDTPSKNAFVAKDLLAVCAVTKSYLQMIFSIFPLSFAFFSFQYI